MRATKGRTSRFLPLTVAQKLDDPQSFVVFLSTVVSQFERVGFLLRHIKTVEQGVRLVRKASFDTLFLLKERTQIDPEHAGYLRVFVAQLLRT